MLTVKQRSEIQQAIWKLEQARKLIESALGDTDAGFLSLDNIDDTIEELQYDLDDNSVDDKSEL